MFQNWGQESADGRDAVIVLGRPDGARVLFRVGDHGAEFEDLKARTPLADPGLAVKERAGAAEKVGERDKGRHEAQEQQADDAGRDVKEPLG